MSSVSQSTSIQPKYFTYAMLNNLSTDADEAGIPRVPSLTLPKMGNSLILSNCIVIVTTYTR